VDPFTSVIADLRARVQALEAALKHQRELTAAAELRARALERSQGLAWRAVLGRLAADPPRRPDPPR